MIIRIVQLTDIHLTAEVDSELYGVDTAVSLQNIVNEIKQLQIPPAAIIATGDLAEDGSKETYLRLRKILKVLKIPVYVLPGNHDDMSEMQTSLTVDGFHCTHSMIMGNWGFVFVNSQVTGQTHGLVNSDAMIALEGNIAALADHPVLVALHHTPSRVCPSFECQLKNSIEFTTLLNKYSNIKGVIAGHTHTASEVNAGGHVQFTTPSTFAHVTHAQSEALVDHDDFWGFHHLDGSQQGFRILDLSPEGVIHSEVCWLKRET